jgi:hypothetical protein
VKQIVKSLLSGHAAAYKTAEVMYENALYIPHIVREGLWPVSLGYRPRAVGSGAHWPRQQWVVSLPQWADFRGLIDALRVRGFQVNEGAHTIYVPPQAGLEVLGIGWSTAYPPAAGFKILKDCREPARARYLFRHRRTLPLLARLIGTPVEQLVVAAALHRAGLGPAIFDLATWYSGDATCTVFVVEHVSGRQPTVAEHARFMARLRDRLAHTPLRVLIPAWERNPDFAPADCNGNLIHSSRWGSELYVDFQNFGLTHE